jgi:hypothetical protein
MTQFKVGDVVSFEMGDQTVYGPITSIHDDREHVSIKGDLGYWVRDWAELELVYAYVPPPEKREPLWVHTHSLVIPKRQGVDEPEIDVTITIREGATPEMIVETLDHFCITVRALWTGDALGDDQYNRVRHDYGDSPHGEARVCCYGKAWFLLPGGKRRTININKCHETTTAYALTRSIRESVQAIGDFYKLAVVEKHKPRNPLPCGLVVNG